MARSRWFVVVGWGWAIALTLVAVACGDSVTGSEIPGTSSGDSGAGRDSSSPSTSDASVPDTNRPSTLPTDGGPPTISATSLDFGEVNCGSTAQPQTFTIQNPGLFIVPWSASLGKGTSSAFLVAPASGSLQPGAAVTVTVTPNPVPQTASTAANGLGDVVTLSLGQSFGSIALKETARGAVLTLPSTIAFGNTPVGIGAVESPFAITNSGNAPANVNLATTGDATFAIVGSTALTAAPGSTGSKIAFTPTTTDPYTGTLTMTVDPAVPLCGPLPGTVALSGAGTNDIIAVTPPSILYGSNGLVDCGTTAATQKVRITNTSGASATFSTALTRGTAVFTVTPATGTVPPNGFVEINVAPKAIPTSTPTTPEAFSDSLTVTTNAPGDSPHTVELHQTARGAILTRSSGSLGFGNVAVGRTVSTQLSFSNTGNVDITVNMANALPEFVQTSPVAISAGAFAAPLFSFTPALLQNYSDIGTLTMATPVPLCGGLPGQLALSGVGVNPSLSAVPTSFNFGFVACGSSANATTIRINNNGPATTYNATLQKGSLRFTVSPATGPIAAGGFVNLTVTPQPIPSTSPISTNFFGDTLDVTSSNGSLSIGLSMTAQGAIFDYNGKTNHAFGAILNGTPVSTPVSVRNVGNIDAAVTLSATSSASSVFGAEPATSTSITANTTLASTITFLPPGPGTIAYTGTWFATPAPGTVLCNPLPAAITLTGSGRP